MTDSQWDHLWEVCFDARVYAEDQIELEKAGIDTGMKRGVWQRKLKDANKALELIETARKKKG